MGSSTGFGGLDTYRPYAEGSSSHHFWRGRTPPALRGVAILNGVAKSTFRA